MLEFIVSKQIPLRPDLSDEQVHEFTQGLREYFPEIVYCNRPTSDVIEVGMRQITYSVIVPTQHAQLLAEGRLFNTLTKMGVSLLDTETYWDTSCVATPLEAEV